MIRMVVSDMDGTLLNKKAEVSAKNLEAIRRLTENNIEFVIASGRDYQGVYSITSRYGLECEAILGNGSQYVDCRGKLLMSCYLKKTLVKEIVKIFMDARIPHMIFTTDGFYTGDEPEAVREAFIERSQKRFGREKEEFDDGGKYRYLPCNQLVKVTDFDEFLQKDLEIMKVEAFVRTPEEAGRIAAAKERLKDISGISFLSSFDDNVEVTDQEAQKGYILDKVIRLKGLSREEVAVVGDGMNDLSMFQLFPVSYAPSNAQETIKNLAHAVVASSADDGFAQAADKELLGNL